MRFWIIVWSFVIAFFGLQTINMFKESNEYTIAMGALTILAIFMWLYSFVHIIVMDFAPLIINFCRVTLPKLEKDLKEKGKDNEGDES